MTTPGEAYYRPDSSETAGRSGQLPQGVLDGAVERRVGVDHLAQPLDRHPGMHGQRSACSAPRRPPGRPRWRRPAPRGRRPATSLMKPSLPALWIQPRADDGTCAMPTRTSRPCSLACASVRPTEPISGSVKVTRGTAWYSARVVLLPEDVGDDDARVVHRHVRERAVPDDVADRPDPGSGPHPVVDRRPRGPARRCRPRPRADAGQVDSPAGRHEQRGPPSDSVPPASVTANDCAVVADHWPAATPVRTPMPSGSKTRASSSLASGSSSGSSRPAPRPRSPARRTWRTPGPARRRSAPPPSTISDVGHLGRPRPPPGWSRTASRPARGWAGRPGRSRC